MKNLDINDKHYQEIEQFKLEYEIIKVFYNNIPSLKYYNFVMKSIELFFIKRLFIILPFLHIVFSPLFKTLVYDFIITFILYLLYGVLGDKVDLDLLKQELDDDYLTKVRTKIKRNSVNNHINLNPNVYLNNIKNTTEKIIQDIYSVDHYNSEGNRTVCYDDIVKLHKQYKEKIEYLETYDL